jgi:hypothetical protein
MEIEDSEAKELFISIAAGVALEGLDSAVHGLQFTGADAIFIAVQDKGFPQSQLLGGLFENLDAADFCLADSGGIPL